MKIKEDDRFAIKGGPAASTRVLVDLKREEMFRFFFFLRLVRQGPWVLGWFGGLSPTTRRGGILQA